MDISSRGETRIEERPKRPRGSVLTEDAPFESDIFGAFELEPLREPPLPRPSPKPARRAKLTDEMIDSLQPETKQFYVWDTKHRGLGVRVGSTGSVTFVLKLSLPGKRSVWKTLEASQLSAAVVEYHTLLAQHGRGEALPKRQAEALWQDVVDRFELDHLGTKDKPKLKPTTFASYQSALKHIREAFKNRPVRVLVYEDVRAFWERMEDRPRQANVCVQLCKQIFDRTEAWKLRELNTNPVDTLRKSGWKPYREEERDVRLSDEQLQMIGAALAGMAAEGTESAFTIAAVRLLFFTGLRLRNVLNLKWAQIDLKGRTLVIDRHKTDADGRPLKTPLNDAALEVLQSLERLTYVKNGEEVEHPFVLPGNLPRDESDEEPKPINDLRKFWKRMLVRAGLEHVQKESGETTTLRRHDVRHAHGNTAADLEMSLQTTAALLGHKNAQTSARYSKKGQHPALVASQRVGSRLRGQMAGEG